MSSGSGAYEVENRRRLQRERAAARARAQAARAELIRRQAAVEQAGRSAGMRLLRSVPGDDASTAELTAWSERAEATAGELAREVARQRMARQAAALVEHLQAVASSGPAVPAAGAAPTPKSSPSTSPPSGLIARVEEVVARLDPDATDAERGQVDAAAEAVLRPGGLPPETLLVQLKQRVRRVDEAAATRRQDQTAAQRLLVSLEGLDGPEVDEERRLLDRVIVGTTPLTSGDRARVAGVRERAIAAEDRRYLAERLADALGALGYETGVAFVEALSAEGSAYAPVAGAPQRAAELRLVRGRYHYRLVHTEPDVDPSDDTAGEVELCKAMGHASARLAEHGVGLTADEHHPSGTAPLEYVPAAAAARTSERPRGAEALRARRRDL